MRNSFSLPLFLSANIAVLNLPNVGRVVDFPVVHNLGFPDGQKREQIEFTGLFGAFPSQAMSKVSSAQTTNNTAADTAANETLQDHVLQIVWGIVGGIVGGAFSGALGALGYLIFVGEIDLPKFSLGRRSKNGPLEKPYRCRPNTDLSPVVTKSDSASF